jgi:hypothetical protein
MNECLYTMRLPLLKGYALESNLGHAVTFDLRLGLLYPEQGVHSQYVYRAIFVHIFMPYPILFRASFSVFHESEGLH